MYDFLASGCHILVQSCSMALMGVLTEEENKFWIKPKNKPNPNYNKVDLCWNSLLIDQLVKQLKVKTFLKWLFNWLLKYVTKMPKKRLLMNQIKKLWKMSDRVIAAVYICCSFWGFVLFSPIKGFSLSFIIHTGGLNIEGVVCCTAECKTLWGKFVISNFGLYIKKTYLTWFD